MIAGINFEADDHFKTIKILVTLRIDALKT